MNITWTRTTHTPRWLSVALVVMVTAMSVAIVAIAITS